MPRRRIAASLALAAAALLFASPPARAASIADLNDVEPGHWAYTAIQALIDKYHVMDGFPDGTFRGPQNVTRYELAAALTKVMQRLDAIQAQIRSNPAIPAPRPQAPSQADLATVARLKAELATELKDVEAKLAENTTLLADLKSKVDKLGAVSGRIGTQFADETLDVGKDRSAPYISTSLSLSFKGKVNDSTSYDAAIGGALKAAGSGYMPGIMGGGQGDVSDVIKLRTARFTSKLGSTTVHVGRFPMWLTGLGPYSTLSYNTGDFSIGAGAVSQDVSSLRTGTDVGIAATSELGPLTMRGGLNSNILIAQLESTAGPFTFQAGYETDHKAITQNILPTGAKVKTTDNAAVVVDFAPSDAFGASAEFNVTNFNPTGYSLGLRGTVRDIGWNLVAVGSQDPGNTSIVATYGGVLAFPSYTLFGVGLPTVEVAALDNYTLMAPPRPDGKPTTGPGGVAMGKNAGVSLRLGIENPIIPNLAFEYNLQAKLIENIFLPNASDPITSETLFLSSSLGF